MAPGGTVIIEGGRIEQHNHPPNARNHTNHGDSLRQLQTHVALAAYASQQDGDAPKCHPNTRMEILQMIINWVATATMGIQWILWVSGAAGGGKSAIARSLVDLCLGRGWVIAFFFFLRTDPTRNTSRPVVATLAYQLIKSIPALDPIIARNIRFHPLIFNDSFESQFKLLIYGPLQQLHKDSPFERPIVLMFDGVDQCGNRDINQVNLISTIAQFVAEKVVPLIVIFSSRAKPQLQKAFNYPKVENILQRLPLDTDYRAENDILLFLEDSFNEIKNTHMLRTSIPSEWPSSSLIQEIVDKSSGQFIYASVVIKFLSSPFFHPVQQLEIIRGLRPVGELMPFAQLDALYQYIFSRVHNITRVIAILAFNLLSHSSSKVLICKILDLTDDDILVAMADLVSIVSFNRKKITFLHASLPDFLQNQSRAQQYYIDKSVWCEHFAIKFQSKKLPYIPMFATYLNYARCTPELREAVYKFRPTIVPLSSASDIYISYLNLVRNMDFEDDGDLYRHQLNLVVRLMVVHFPGKVPGLGKEHDIMGILDEIKWEKAGTKNKLLKILYRVFSKSRSIRRTLKGQ